MKLTSIKLKNYRGYKNEVKIKIDNMTSFIGKNDIGKSTILEALDVFFTDGKPTTCTFNDKDVNVENKANGNLDILISATFSELPEVILIDGTNPTTLSNEYLLNRNGELEIIKTFPNGEVSASKKKIAIRAYHPTNPSCSNLLQMPQKALQKIIEENGIDCEDNRINALMRQSIWNHYDDLQLDEVDLVTNNKDGDLKDIWEKLKPYMPSYSLFQSDRTNNDENNEIQDPLKIAVKNLFKEDEIANHINFITQKVIEELQRVSDGTLAKIKEFNPEIANSLHPEIKTDDLKWADVFKKVSISGDQDIPMNKRGSGIKRLILLGFFREEAERRQKDGKNPSIIYAIEEPETSQHHEHQKLLMDALLLLSQNPNTQIIITTHSSDIVKMLDKQSLRLVRRTEDGEKTVTDVEPGRLPWTSLNEINFTAFGDYSIEYHNELYGYLQSKAVEENPANSTEVKFEEWLVNKGCNQSKSWIRIKNGIPIPAQPSTIHTYVRNCIHHPENAQNAPFTEEEKKKSIDEMRRIIESIR